MFLEGKPKTNNPKYFKKAINFVIIPNCSKSTKYKRGQRICTFFLVLRCLMSYVLKGIPHRGYQTAKLRMTTMKMAASTMTIMVSTPPVGAVAAVWWSGVWIVALTRFGRFHAKAIQTSWIDKISPSNEQPKLAIQISGTPRRGYQYILLTPNESCIIFFCSMKAIETSWIDEMSLPNEPRNKPFKYPE